MEVATGIMPPYTQYAQVHDPRSHKFHPAVMTSNPGPAHPGYLQEQHVLYSNSPAHAPTPPEDPNKTSLPSISNLLQGIADGEKANAQLVPENHMHPPPPQQTAPEYHPSASDYHYRPAAPPTPPMRSDSMPDVVQSPSTISSHSSFSGPSLGTTMNNIDAAHQRTHVPTSAVPKPPHVIYSTSPYAVPGYMPSPSNASVSSGGFYSPEMMYPNGIYQQKPLPSNFPPPVMPAPMLPPGVFPQGYSWEQHQYMNAAAQAAFPSVQDRYICPICKKAFSRPSSLKIHSHSHTGEKPFKCPHPGCGKAFSVRSNMKRHERGCHPINGSYSSS